MSESKDIFITDDKPKRKKKELTQEQKEAFKERMRAGREAARKKRGEKTKEKKEEKKEEKSVEPVDVTLTETAPDTPVQTTEEQVETEINLDEPIQVNENDISELDKELINLQLDIEELKKNKTKKKNTTKSVIIKKKQQSRKLDDDYIQSLVDKRIQKLVEEGNKAKAEQLRKKQENKQVIQTVEKPLPKPKPYRIGGQKPWWDN